MQEEGEILSVVPEKKESLAKDLLKNSFWSFMTSMVARIGGVIFAIVIARILQPELFGIYSLALSVMFLVMTFTDLGINATIIRYLADSLKKRNSKKAASYFQYLLKIKFILTVSCAFLLLAASYPLSVFVFRKPALFVPLAVCSVYLLFLSFVGFYESLFYLIRKVNYTTIKEAIHQSCKILFAFLGAYLIANKLLGVFAGLTVAAIITLTYLLIVVYKTQSYLFKKTALLGSKEVVSLKKFIFFLTIGSLTGAFFAYIDIITLGIFVKAEYIGFYRAAFGIIGAVSGLISVTNLLLPIFTQLEGKNLERVFNKILKSFAILSFPAAFGVAFVAKPFINIIYGPAYIGATAPLYLLSFLIIEFSFSGLFIWLFAAKSKPEITTKIIIISTVMNLTLNILAAVFLLPFGPMPVVLGVAAATLISRYYALFALAEKTKKILKLKVNGAVIIKPLIASLIMLFSLIVFKRITNLIWPEAILEIVFAAVVYFAVFILIKGFDKEDIALAKKLVKSC